MAMGFRYMGPFVSFVREGWEKTFFVAKFFCFLHVIDAYLVTPVQTFGPSMLPAIDLVPNVFLAERISTRFGKVSCGDIVVLQSPQNPRKFITKRLVGMEGDSVTYISSPGDSDKRETVVGVMHKQWKAHIDDRGIRGVAVVPKGHVWVQGDNAYNTNDSRNFGPVPFGLIESRLFWRVWPLKYFGPFWKQ